MNTRIPIRPLAPGKLRPLLRRKNHQRIIRLPGLIQHRQNLTHLLIQHLDLRQIFGIITPRLLRIRQIRRQLQRIQIKMLGIAQRPRRVRLKKTRHKTKRRISILIHKRANTLNAKLGIGMRTPPLNTRHIFKRKTLIGTNVLLATKPHAIPQIPQKMRKTPRPRTRSRMIPARPIARRIQPRIKRRTARIAHRHRQIRPIKNQTILRQSINIRRIHILPTVKRQIEIRRIICDHNQNIRFHSPSFLSPNRTSNSGGASIALNFSTIKLCIRASASGSLSARSFS